jgi:hypothetical protein
MDRQATLGLDWKSCPQESRGIDDFRRPQSSLLGAITTHQQLQLQHTSSCNYNTPAVAIILFTFLTDIWVELYSSCNHT